MSWQAYVDDHLMVELPSKQMLKSAAICGMDGGIWAKSEAFPDITDEQIAALVSALENADAEAKI